MWALATPYLGWAGVAVGVVIAASPAQGAGSGRGETVADDTEMAGSEELSNVAAQRLPHDQFDLRAYGERNASRGAATSTQEEVWRVELSDRGEVGLIFGPGSVNVPLDEGAVAYAVSEAYEDAAEGFIPAEAWFCDNQVPARVTLGLPPLGSYVGVAWGLPAPEIVRGRSALGTTSRVVGGGAGAATMTPGTRHGPKRRHRERTCTSTATATARITSTGFGHGLRFEEPHGSSSRRRSASRATSMVAAREFRAT